MKWRDSKRLVKKGMKLLIDFVTSITFNSSEPLKAQ